MKMKSRLASVLFFFWILPSMAENAEPERTNILWITAEDLSPDLGCYGDVQAHTPNLDSLAEQGARYTSAFTVSPVCAPSRSSIITGMYPTSIGTHHMRSKGVPPPNVRCFTEYLRAAGYYCTNNSKTDYNFDSPITAWDENGKTAHWRNRAKGQPFFAVFNITTTHESQIRAPNETFEQVTHGLSAEIRHAPSQVSLPPYYPDTPVVRRDWSRYYDLVTVMDQQVATLLQQLEQDGLCEETAVFFFGDHGRGLPRAKRWIYDSGIHVPLIVRWPRQIIPGMICRDLISLIDLAPTMLSIAGIKPPAHFQGQPFLGSTRASPREFVFAARDRMDETYDIIRAVRNQRFKYIRNFQPCKPYAQYIHYMEQMPTMQEMRRLNKEGRLIGPQKLFFLPEKPVEELYDILQDPHEVNNLVNSPTHLPTLLQMRKELENWMSTTGDLGVISEEELTERVRPGGNWLQTASPVLSPSGGTFAESVTVTISCPTKGASIAYTLDVGPNTHWKLFVEPLVLKTTSQLRVRACRLGYKDSPVVKMHFVKNGCVTP